MKKENSFHTFCKELWNIKSLKVFWQVIIYVLLISMSFTCVVKIYNKNEIVKTMKSMYFLDFTISKDKEFILEVMTNPFLEINNDDELQEATLHLKNGKILDVLVDTNENMFVIESDINKNIKNKTYKYNSTIKNSEDKIDNEVQE